MKNLPALYLFCFTCLTTACQMQTDPPNTHHKPGNTPQPTDSLSQSYLDSLASFPQGSMQSDLYYQLILERYPDTQEAYMSRSVAYTKRGDHQTGFALLNKAVELNPVQNLGYRSFVKLYMLHDYEGALADCLRLDSLTAHAKPGVWGEDMDMVIGLCYLQLNQLEPARTYLNQSLKRIEKKYGQQWLSPRTLLYLAITHHKEGHDREALEVLDKLTSIYPNYTEAYYYRACCYAALHDRGGLESAVETGRRLFNKYGVETNPYFELPYQVYPSLFSDLSENP